MGLAVILRAFFHSLLTFASYWTLCGLGVQSPFPGVHGECPFVGWLLASVLQCGVIAQWLQLVVLRQLLWILTGASGGRYWTLPYDKNAFDRRGTSFPLLTFGARALRWILIRQH